MSKRLPIFAIALLFIAGISLAQTNPPDVRSWSGVIINNTCGPEQAFAEAPECTQKGVAGAKPALYDDTTRQVYILDPQEQATGHEGDSVTINGRLEGNIIHVSSLKMQTSMGLPIGRKAPAFSARDQFGTEQSLDTLKGPNGTVLLFFRSADW